MKVRRTLFFMLWNPPFLIFYFLLCWISLSALITMLDDPFIHGTWPDVVEAAEGIFENLPGSIWKLVAALSIIIDDIVKDFASDTWPIAILLAPIFGYREARSSLKAITTEWQIWMQWYDRQQAVKAQEGTYETPPLSAYIPGDSHFISARKTVRFMLRNLRLSAGYFVCWIFLFTLLALPVPLEPSIFVQLLPQIVIPPVIFTFIFSYREAKGNLKGTATQKRIWVQWYYHQIRAITQGDTLKKPPSLESEETYSCSEEILATLNFMRHNLRPFIVQLMCWISVSVLLFFIALPTEDTPEDIMELFELIGIYEGFLPWITMIVFMISYREAKGNLKGIAKAQNVWMQWYHQHLETIKRRDTFEGQPPSENTQADSYFRTAQKTVQFMARNPMGFIAHLTCWFSVYIFIFDEAIHLVPLLFMVMTALISSYQEAKGTVKGMTEAQIIWTKWYQRQTGAKEHGYSLAEVPPMLNIN